MFDFIRPITPVACHSQKRYIIIVIEYLTRWEKAAPVKDCIIDTKSRFIFENIITRFGCPRSLTSDQGTHFINATVKLLLKNFMIQHHKSISYHPQANGTVEAFKKILEKRLTKICSANWDDYDEIIRATLWAYRTMVKRLHNQMPFQMVYGKEAVVPTEFIVPNIFIATTNQMSEEDLIRRNLQELHDLEEPRLLAHFHQ